MRLSFRGEREARGIRRNAGEGEKWMSGEEERTNYPEMARDFFTLRR